MFKKYLTNPNLPFWLITFSTLIGLTLPTLIQDGMFMDGMLYASVAHNLSKGIGTFWFPQFSSEIISHSTSFHEQPPLVFGIQAIFFKIMGDSMYTERIYIFITLCISAYLINLFWKRLPVSTPEKEMGWLAVILWITIPICFWSFSSDMMENTMGIFTLIAGLLIFKKLHSGKLTPISYLLPGILIFLATLSKGVPGFFPVALPFLYWLSISKTKFRLYILPTLILTLVPLITYSILILSPEIRESLSIYFFERLVGRINNESSVSSHFQIIGHTFTQLLPQLIFLALAFLLYIATGKLSLLSKAQKNLALFFILAGIAGSMPIALTRVQSDFYIDASLPFYAIGFALLTSPLLLFYISQINIEKIGYKIFTGISAIALVIAILFSALQVGKTNRNKEMLHDVYILGKIIPENSFVSVPQSMWNYWELRCYLVRYFNIGISPESKKQFYLLARELHLPPPLITEN